MKQHKKFSFDASKSVYILPNIFTTISLALGFYSIINAISGNYEISAWSILFAAICDVLDGTVARMTHTTSSFGVEYDSLCDLVSFGVAPSILAYQWALKPESLSVFKNYDAEVGAIAAFLLLACGALRLARFNVLSSVRDPGFFQGLPITGGAGIVASMVLWHYRNNLQVTEPNGLFVLVLVVCLALLMVSGFDYLSHKNKAIFRSRKPFKSLTILIVVFGLIAIKPKSLFLPLGILYIFSGPIVTSIKYIRKKKCNISEDTEKDRKK